jgi:RND family efflux transporter MFP subunit
MGVVANMFLRQSAAVPIDSSTRQVEVRSVAALSSENAPLSIAGTVRSKSEASVRAESSGRVTAVYRNLGDSVGAGTIIAELESASGRAALLQAQGVEAAAQAGLEKIQKGTRAEQLDILRSALDGAKSGAVNALLLAYTSVDGAVRSTTDTFFSNPTSAAPHFNITTSNTSWKTSAESQRVALGAVLDREKARSSTISASDDLNTELTRSATELRTVRDFLDSVIASLNSGIPTLEYPTATIATYIANASAARASINTALSALSGAKQSLETSQSNLEQGVTGAQPEDIAAAKASLMQAQGAVAAARANLERAVIRAPISGTINSFSLKEGDYVSAGSEVLTVANNHALEVIAYMTESDTREVAIGQKVAFDTGASGVVTRIAPALDPVTKKIEMRIGITDRTVSLVNGQSVLALIDRVNPTITTTSRVTIPISAIKVQADKVTVFTVNPDMTLVSHMVTLGTLLGDRVEIKGGLTGDMMIVTDARGLREGQIVEVVSRGGPVMK